jgi:propanediol dehydratase large subunit
VIVLLVVTVAVVSVVLVVVMMAVMIAPWSRNTPSNQLHNTKVRKAPIVRILTWHALYNCIMEYGLKQKRE